MRPEIELSAGDRHDDFTAHKRTLEVSVGVVLGTVVFVLRVRLLGREFLQPFLVVAVQAALVVVDEHRRRDMHGVDQHQPFLDFALGHGALDPARDVEKLVAFGGVEPEFLAVGFHESTAKMIIFHFRPE